ncbi:MAG: membrane integrity-associated transporter subunit PqiC [Burkholderiaceae bacterium]|nr:membrane integrity-associated transporter subunit PqiC [Burkholderiaceae bacterium]
MNTVAINTIQICARGIFLSFFLVLAACSLPHPAQSPVVYDFGPGARQQVPANRMAPLPPLEVSAPRANAALAGQAVLYRLAYADAQALKPYTLARWSMPPAQLIDQRLREQLGLRRAVLGTGELMAATAARRGASSALATPSAGSAAALNLRLELEEFSQLFETQDQSTGLLRLRATLMRRSPAGDTLLGQRTFIVQKPAATADAAGGVRALAAAADQAVSDIEGWLAQVQAGGATP